MILQPYNYHSPKLVMIRASAVATHFDQTDLARRQNSDKKLEIKYHENWIHIEKNLFCVPSFYIRNGKAFVGIGRHRLTLLSKLVAELPVAFEEFKDDKRESQKAYDEIVIRDLVPDESFEFPDLPIDNLGDDVNGEPTWKK
ncbi:MAG: hypothetical protein NTY00_11780 [Deltaproteobacteria bacterium]|nr:hypothetical protein [Deltaproteobacteria bacterium]